MCAINGILTIRPGERLRTDIGLMNLQVVHRGPDDSGIRIWDDRLGMGMRRLSIIDLKYGQQPMSDPSDAYHIVFNGEIYNHKQLRRELQLKGHVFRSHSDTEVLLRMYIEHKEDMLPRLRGMFAFSIYDLGAETLLIARDRFGEKPLYYSLSDQELIWASELKSILQVRPGLNEIDRESLRKYLRLSYIPAPYTIYQGVRKLKSGHFLKVDVNTLQCSEHEFYQPQLRGPEPWDDIRKAKAELKKRLYESVEECMVADVPVGVFLSGGVDSTVIAAIMSRIKPGKINTFTVGFTNRRYDESDRARQVADHLRTVHHSSVLEYKNVFSELQEIITNYDEPFADSSMIPTWYVSRHASAYVKVALTGDGADEIFGGYNKYLMLSYGKWFRSLTPSFLHKPVQNLVNSPMYKNGDTRSLRTKFKKMVNASGPDFIDNHFSIISMGFSQPQLEKLLSGTSLPVDFSEYIPAHAPGVPPLQLIRNIDLKLSLEGDMLVKTDRVSMMCSVECRAPFLDHRLAALADSLPDNYLIRHGRKKWILKETFADHLPVGFLEAPKKGFEVPIGSWFRGPLKSDLMKELSEEACARHGLFNYPYVNQLLSQHLYQDIDHSSRLWTLYCFQKWYSSMNDGV